MIKTITDDKTVFAFCTAEICRLLNMHTLCRIVPMTGKAPALEKGLKILELVLASDQPLTLSAIAQGVEYKVSEIQRMVDYLAQEHYLIRTASGAYAPGMKAYSLADLGGQNALVSRAEGPLRRFALRTGESVHIAVLVEDMLHVVYNVEGRGPVCISVKPGLYAARGNASGNLLLAYRDQNADAASGGKKTGAARDGAAAAAKSTGPAGATKGSRICLNLSEGAAKAEFRADGGAARHSSSDAEVLRRHYDFSELRCVRGIYSIAVPVAFGPSPCAAAIASPYALRATGSSFRADILDELRRTALEISGLF